jgi:HKD family nuclease
MTYLHLQDPNDADRVSLLEVLLEASETAKQGAGAFAFASASGISLLLEDPSFVKLLGRGGFELIVGVDGTTDTRAIEKLRSLAREHPNLQAKVFLSPGERPIFHPKLCWFRDGDVGTVIVGSGNLTQGGLIDNWEAFSVARLGNEEFVALEKDWLQFKIRAASNLVALDDPEVARRAEQNSSKPTQLKRATRPARTILVAELPNGGNARKSQVNFRKEAFFGFFGAKPGALFRYVFSDVTTPNAVPESRACVEAQSQNYRFELNALKGRPYPVGERPIGVFERVGTRSFRYCVLFPGDPDYKKVKRFLEKHSIRRGQFSLNYECSSKVLQAAWPNALLWK